MENVIEMKSFLALCVVHIRFVPNVAHIAAQLNKTLCKGEPLSRAELITDEPNPSFNL